MSERTKQVEQGRTISREDFYKLNGLLVLAAEHEAALRTIAKAAAEITGDPDDGFGYYGITSDAIADGSSATVLLGRLKIEVEDV